MTGWLCVEFRCFIFVVDVEVSVKVTSFGVASGSCTERPVCSSCEVFKIPSKTSNSIGVSLRHHDFSNTNP